MLFWYLAYSIFKTFDLFTIFHSDWLCSKICCFVWFLRKILHLGFSTSHIFCHFMYRVTVYLKQDPGWYCSKVNFSWFLLKSTILNFFFFWLAISKKIYKLNVYFWFSKLISFRSVFKSSRVCVMILKNHKNKSCIW